MKNLKHKRRKNLTQKRKDKLKNLINSASPAELYNIERAFKWRGIFGVDREWDWVFTIRLLKRKLELDYQYYSGIKRKTVANQLKRAIWLTKKVLADGEDRFGNLNDSEYRDYVNLRNYEIYIPQDSLLYFKNTEYSKSILVREKSWKILWHYLEHYTKYWWD